MNKLAVCFMFFSAIIVDCLAVDEVPLALPEIITLKAADGSKLTISKQQFVPFFEKVKNNFDARYSEEEAVLFFSSLQCTELNMLSQFLEELNRIKNEPDAQFCYFEYLFQNKQFFKKLARLLAEIVPEKKSAFFEDYQNYILEEYAQKQARIRLWFVLFISWGWLLHKECHFDFKIVFFMIYIHYTFYIKTYWPNKVQGINRKLSILSEIKLDVTAANSL